MSYFDNDIDALIVDAANQRGLVALTAHEAHELERHLYMRATEVGGAAFCSDPTNDSAHLQGKVQHHPEVRDNAARRAVNRRTAAMPNAHTASIDELRHQAQCLNAALDHVEAVGRSETAGRKPFLVVDQLQAHAHVAPSAGAEVLSPAS